LDRDARLTAASDGHGACTGSTQDEKQQEGGDVAGATLQIAGRRIGPDDPPYVVAEMSANHRGSCERAMAILEAAAAAGADAVKLQTYTADTITLDHDGPGFTINAGPWAGRRLWDLYDEAHTPWEWHESLFVRGRELGVAVFSSPFDATAVALLERLQAPAYKIASFELVDLPLIQLVAATGKPVILSTGMASPDEIADAVAAARKAGCRGLAILHAVSGYPTPAEQANLRAIQRLADEHDAVIGLSDHTPGTVVATAAVALGARMIEKHVTLQRSDGGPDAEFSLEPHELATLVADARTAWTALGDGGAARPESERAQTGLRRSLHAVADIAAGEILTADNVRSIRPGGGLAPVHIDQLLGHRSRTPVPRGTPLQWSHVDVGTNGASAAGTADLTMRNSRRHEGSRP
jgi:N-acetylneuraminate synthase